jgi:hypothetical protein
VDEMTKGSAQANAATGAQGRPQQADGFFTTSQPWGASDRSQTSGE